MEALKAEKGQAAALLESTATELRTLRAEAAAASKGHGEQLAGLQQELAAKRAALETEMAGLVQKHAAQLKEQLDELAKAHQQKLQELQAQLDELATAKAALEEQRRLDAAEREGLAAELEQARLRAGLERQLSIAQRQTTAQCKRLAALRAQVEQAMGALDAAQQASRSEAARLVEAKAQLDGENQNTARLEAEVDAVQARVDDLWERGVIADKQLPRLRAQAAKEKRELDYILGLQQDVRSRTWQYQDSWEAEADTLDDLEREAAAVKAALDDLEREAAAAKAALDERRQQAAELRSLVAALAPVTGPHAAKFRAALGSALLSGYRELTSINTDGTGLPPDELLEILESLLNDPADKENGSPNPRGAITPPDERSGRPGTRRPPSAAPPTAKRPREAPAGSAPAQDPSALPQADDSSHEGRTKKRNPQGEVDEAQRPSRRKRMRKAAHPKAAAPPDPEGEAGEEAEGQAVEERADGNGGYGQEDPADAPAQEDADEEDPANGNGGDGQEDPADDPGQAGLKTRICKQPRCKEDGKPQPLGGFKWARGKYTNICLTCHAAKERERRARRAQGDDDD
ncbi:hypothetical protein WJX72_006794 [[Myrmecia] bisecta]|uniref:GATA-type domain-containing protein n=1 Tax=[Myrmecia] bisecta TaxID=41462 RepID=A0AAW1P1P5_9CHLO